MQEIVDCLLIGHNEIPFEEFEKSVRLVGEDYGFFRDMGLDYINYKGIPYTAAGIYNVLRYQEGRVSDQFGLFGIGNTFSPAIAYLGTFLSRRGLAFDFINSFQEEKDKLAEKLAKGNIRVVGITTTFYLSVTPITEIVKFIKKHNEKVKIVIGGPFILGRLRTLNKLQIKMFLKTTGGDIYINSPQGEMALFKIIEALKNDSPMDNIDNITFRNMKTFITTNSVPENNILEENMVDWSLFTGSLSTNASVRASLSCPYSCAFCNIPEREGKYQTASVKAVEVELDKLYEIGKIRRINFVDDTFNIPTERFKNILRMMIKNKYGFKWSSYFRSQYADREMLELMSESGCEGVFLGVESGNERILKNMNKFSDIEKYLRTIEMLKEFNILSYVSIIIGFPGETQETAKDTIKFIRESRPDFFNANIMYFDEYTPIWREREKYKIIGKEFDWSHETMDSNTALNILEEMFLKINESVWIPEYNFEFPGIFNLKNRGLSFEKIKEFIGLFNEGIRNKIRDSKTKELDDKLVIRMREIAMHGRECK